jgi:hypothetical protein
MFGLLHAAVCADSVLQWLRRAYYARKHSVDGDTSRLPELATALRHVFIVSGVQLLAKATSFHVTPGDITKIVLARFVLFITGMNNCCPVISAPGKTGRAL